MGTSSEAEMEIIDAGIEDKVLLRFGKLYTALCGDALRSCDCGDDDEEDSSEEVFLDNSWHARLARGGTGIDDL